MPGVPEIEPGFEEVLRARRSIGPYLQPTPLLHWPGLDALLDAEVWVKHENHTPIGAFKVRGGVYLASTLSEAERRAGLYTASTGNHGQSIAWAGRAFGIPVTVAVPEVANPAKVASMRALGAEVVHHGPDFDAAREWIAGVAEEKGARFVGPTEPELIAGVATYALEMVEAQPDLDAIFVPVGAGSGAAGCCLVAKTLRPATQVIGVQAERAPSIERAWRSGALAEGKMETRAEGLATRVPFANTLRILRDAELGLDDFALVSDEAMEEAIVTLLAETRNLAEHAGASPLAAALARREALRGKRIALVLSGGNLGPEALRDVLARRLPS